MSLLVGCDASFQQTIRDSRVQRPSSMAWLDCGCLAVIYLGAWLSLKHIPGWPQNDDPFYAKTVSTYWQDGTWVQYRQQGELSAVALVHQALGILGCGLFGVSFHSLFLTCLIQQWLGVSAIYVAARNIGVARATALVTAAGLAFYPIYFGHAFTFMTDGPATAWAAVAIACFAYGICQRQQRFIWVGSAVIATSVWIRQTNLLLLVMPLAAIGWETWVTKSWRGILKQSFRVWLLPLLSMAFIESELLIQSNRERLSTVEPGSWTPEKIKFLVVSVYGLGLLIGLILLPTAMMQWQAIRHSLQQATFRPRVCGWVSGSVGAIFLLPMLTTSGRACLTNSTGCFLQNAHWGPIFLSDMDLPGRWSDLGGVTWPWWIWQSITLACIVTLALTAWWITWSIVRVLREKEQLSNPIFISGMSLFVTAVVAVPLMLLNVKPLMDRYWLFLFPALGFMVGLMAQWHAWPVSRLAIGFAVLMVAIYFGTTMIFTHDLLAWNNARWQFVTRQVPQLWAAEELDAGRDVNAWYRMDEDANTFPRSGDTSSWWSGRAIYSISIGPRRGWKVIDRLPWTSWATGATHELLVLEQLQGSKPSMRALVVEETK